MLSLRESTKIYISLSPVDMRKAIDGLCALVIDVLNESPQSGHVFVFFNRARNKVKCLVWDRNGFILHYKRLERGRLTFSLNPDKGVIELTQDQLGWLLAGLDFSLMNEFPELNYGTYY